MTDLAQQARHPRIAARTAGVAGLATVVLLFGAQGLIQVGGVEPSFDAPTGEILGFFETRDGVLYGIGTYLSVVGMVASRAVWTTSVWLVPYALLWFWVIAVCVLLLRRRSEATR